MSDNAAHTPSAAARDGRNPRCCGGGAIRPPGRGIGWRCALPLAWLIAAGSAIGAEEAQDLDAIRLAVESFVAAETSGARGDRIIEVTNLDSRLRLTPCGDAIRPFFAPGSRGGAHRTVGVSCPAPKPWTIYVSVRVTYRAEVLVAARALPRGAIIGAGDLVVEERDLDDGGFGWLSDTAEALGKQVNRPLRAGTPVSTSVLEEMPVVTRGQRVWLVAESAYLQVRMMASALQDGAPGELIRVRNLETEKVVEGVVGEDGVVRIRL